MSELRDLGARVKAHQKVIAVLVDEISSMTASMDKDSDTYVEPGLHTHFRARVRKHQVLITSLIDEILSLTAPEGEVDAAPSAEVDLRKYFRDSPEFLSEMIAPFKQAGKPGEVKGV